MLGGVHSCGVTNSDNLVNTAHIAWVLRGRAQADNVRMARVLDRVSRGGGLSAMRCCDET